MLELLQRDEFSCAIYIDGLQLRFSESYPDVHIFFCLLSKEDRQHLVYLS